MYAHASAIPAFFVASNAFAWLPEVITRPMSRISTKTTSLRFDVGDFIVHINQFAGANVYAIRIASNIPANGFLVVLDTPVDLDLSVRKALYAY